MTAVMDLGTLVAAIQIKDTDFERVLTKAAQTAKSTEQKVQQALSHIEMDIDASSFERSMSEAPKAAKDAGKQITQALGDVGQVLAEQTRAVQDNARAWAQNRLDPARVQELKTLGVATEDYIQAISGVPGAQSKVRSALEGNSSALKNLEQDTRAVAEAQKDFDRTVSQIAATLNKQNGAVTENTRVWAANKIGTDNLRILEQLGVKTSEYVDAVVGVPGALQRMQTALDGQGDALNRLNTLTGQVSQAQRDFALRQRAIGDSTQGAAQDVNRAAGLIDRAGDASARATPLVGGLGNAFDKARTAMIALFAASTFVDFIREAVKAASDFEQSAGGVTAVFADASREIEDFGRTSAQSVGLATAEYQNMATVFGSQLKNMGTSVADLAPMTNKLIILGADLAAQYGGSTSDAVESLSALLRGERDPIEKYGVGIKQADVNARLAAEGLDNLTGSAAKNAELQATLAILTEQTASAQGAFGRETDTLAHKQQVANAEFENAKAKIGDQLIPLWATFTDMLANDGVPALEAVARVLGPIADFLANVVGLFADLPGPIQAAVIALGGVVLLNGPLARTGTTLWGIVTGSSAAAVSMTRFGFAAKAALGFLGGPIGLAIIGITTALSFMGGETEDTTVSVEGLAAAVDDATGKFRDNAKEIAINEVVSSGMAQQYAAMGGSVEDLVLALLGNEDAQARVNAKAAEFEKYARTTEDIDLAKSFTDAYSGGLRTIADAQDKGTIKAKLNEENQKQLAKATAEGGDAAGDSKAKWDDLSDSQKLAADSAKFVSEKLKDAAEQAKLLADQTEAAQWLGEFKSQADDAARAADILKVKIDELDGRSRSLDDATAAQVSSLEALRKGFEDGTKAATENTEAGNLNTGALADWNVAALNATSDGRALYGQLNSMADAHTDLVAAAYNSAVAEGDVAGAADKAQEAAKNSRQAFVDLATQYLGGNVEAAQALADKLGILDEQKIDDKTFDVIGDDAKAQAAVDRANKAVVNDKLFQIRADAVDALLQAQTLNEQLKEIDGKEVTWHAIGNVVVSVTKEDAAAANAKAQNFGYGATNYGWTGGRVGDLLRGFAGGGRVDKDGRITGPGGGKDDLVVGFGPDGRPLRLSNEETIMNAGASKRWGWLLALMNADKFAAGGRVGGGRVGGGNGAEFGATLTGQVSAPDPADVKGPWQQIAAAVTDAWDQKIRPALESLEAESEGVGVGFRELLDDQATPVWQGIQDAVTVASRATGQQQVTLQGVVGAQWAMMAAAQTKSLGDAKAGAYQPWADWSVRLGDAQGKLAGTTASQWSAISGSVVDAQKGKITPAFDTLNTGSDGVGNRFSALAGTSQAQWQAIAGTVDSAKSGTILPAIDAIGQAAGGLETAFGSAASGIASKWSEIKPGVADPVNWLLGSVWNQGLVGAWGKIKGWLPSISTELGTLDLVGYAGGGVIPGMDPGRRDNRLVPMRSGEGVLVPEAVGPLGGESGINRINRLAEQGRLSEMFGRGYATGGVVDSWAGIGSLSSAFGGPDQSLPEDMVAFVKAFVANPYDVITDLVGEPLVRASQYDSGFGQAMTGATGEMVGGVIGTLKDMFGLENDGKGGPPKLDGSGTLAMDGVLFVDGEAYALPSGTRGEFLKAVASKMGTSYAWGAAGPDVFDCSGLMSWALAQAGAGVGRLTADDFHKGFPHVGMPGKPGDLATYSARYSKGSGMAGHIGAILDVGKGLMMHTDGAGPARVSDYRSREGGPLSIVDALGGAAQMGEGIGELPAIIARVIYGDYGTAAGVGAIDPGDVTGEVAKWESTRTINTVDPIQDFGPMNMSRGRPEWVGYVPPGDPVNRWAPMVAEIQQRKGKYSPENLANALGQNRLESGGNPLAYNDYDRNFTAGHPSKSMWQTIPTTFRANAQPGFGFNIWHPPSNYWAADNYTDGKYGGRFPLRAYDKGGGMPPGIGVFGNFTGQTEEVLTGQERRAWVQTVKESQRPAPSVQIDYDRLAKAVTGAMGGRGVAVDVNVNDGAIKDLVSVTARGAIRDHERARGRW